VLGGESREFPAVLLDGRRGSHGSGPLAHDPPGCPSDLPFVRLPNCGTQVAEFERMAEWLKRNGLSVALAMMFVVAFAGQAIAGLLTHNQELAEHGQPTISLGAYLLSAHFFEATFENWESEFLQTAVFVLLTAVLYATGIV
jgi:hypothetical protein